MQMKILNCILLRRNLLNLRFGVVYNYLEPQDIHIPFSIIIESFPFRH